MISINLLPPELKQKRTGAKRNASLVSICIVVVIAVIVLGLISSVAKDTINARLEYIQASIRQNQAESAEAKEVEKMALLINDRSQAFSDINKKRAIWSQILTDLAGDAPTDVQFENINATTDKLPNFILQGNTTTEREIIKFKEKLEGSGFFRNVNFKSSALVRNEKENTEKIKFTLEFDLEKLSSAGKNLGDKNK